MIDWMTVCTCNVTYNVHVHYAKNKTITRILFLYNQIYVV